eukprot:scaffold3434_cov252-Chaetoceros_neogracile.AAC.16
MAIYTFFLRYQTVPTSARSVLVAGCRSLCLISNLPEVKAHVYCESYEFLCPPFSVKSALEEVVPSKKFLFD